MSSRKINHGGQSRRKANSKSKIKVFSRSMKTKLARLFIIILVALAGLGVVLIRIQAKDGEEYEGIVMSQQTYQSKTIPFKRGDITDRNGNLLATSIKVYNVVLDAFVMTSKEEYIEPTIAALDECFEQVTAEELRAAISANSSSRYIVLDSLKKLTYEQIEAFDNILNDSENYPNVKGVWFEEEYKRMYPYSSLASSTIGFTASGNVGVIGLESYYNDYLNGTDGREYGYVNEDNTMEPVVKEAKDGNNLVSTLDLNLQTICEKYIAQWVTEYNPAIVAVVMADPNTGEILAMADNNSIFDLNNPSDLSRYYTTEEINAMDEQTKMDNQNKMWRNFCVSDTYEAGSTIKPFTIAGALEDGKITTDMTFVCDGFETYSKAIHCHKRSGHGTQTVEQAIMNSCNDALMQISRLEGVETFCKYQSIFGFGMRSGIDLPGEASCEGLLFSADVMTLQDLATNSFGQNFNVNMMQMVAGFSSLINGGYYYKPHVIKQVLNSKGGVVESYDKQLIKQTITKETSDFLKQAMLNTVESGTGKTAAVEGYEVGGKTGTAQHHNKDDDDYLLSFLGFAPYDNPQVVCYVIVDSPDVPDKASSAYASRLFSAIMTEALPYMNIFPTKEVETTEPQTGQESTAEQGSTAGQESTTEQGSTAGQESTAGQDENTQNPEGETTAPLQMSTDEVYEAGESAIDDEDDGEAGTDTDTNNNTDTAGENNTGE